VNFTSTLPTDLPYISANRKFVIKVEAVSGFTGSSTVDLATSAVPKIRSLIG